MDRVIAAFQSLLRADPGHCLLLQGERGATLADVDSLARAFEPRLAAGSSGLDSPGLDSPGSGKIVALLAPNGVGFLAGLLAVRRLGACVLLVDASMPRPAAERVATAMGAIALAHCASAWPAGAEALELVRLPLPRSPPAGAAFLKLTSGSTGVPRAVAVSTEQVLADDAALCPAIGLGGAERIVAGIPLSHAYGFSVATIPALVRGATLIVPVDQSPLALINEATRHGATVLPAAPAWLAAMTRHAGRMQWPTSVRRIVSASAPLPPESARRFREAFGISPQVFYGASETGGICIDTRGDAAERGSVGSPLPGVEVTVVPNAEGGGDVVQVRSGAVGIGYFPVPDDRLSGGRFVTSDIAAFRGGELVLLGRSDHVINVRGRKVQPSEIEAVVAALPGVLDVAAVGVATGMAEGDRVRVLVVAASGDLSATHVVDWCRERMAHYKVPRSVQFVSSLPRTERGKMDRSRLALLAEDPR